MTDQPKIDVAALLAAARRPQDLRTQALAGVIGTAAVHGRTPLIRGLSEARFQKLVNEYFPLATLRNDRETPPRGEDEFGDLLALLLEHRAEPSEENAWLAHAIASAAMEVGRLRQDMGLADDDRLAQLMRENFPALAPADADGAKWKRLFHREVRARAGLAACDLADCPACHARIECFDEPEVAA